MTKHLLMVLCPAMLLSACAMIAIGVWGAEPRLTIASPPAPGVPIFIAEPNWCSEGNFNGCDFSGGYTTYKSVFYNNCPPEAGCIITPAKKSGAHHD